MHVVLLGLNQDFNMVHIVHLVVFLFSLLNFTLFPFILFIYFFMSLTGDTRAVVL
jgi:hypothetical protein